MSSWAAVPPLPEPDMQIRFVVVLIYVSLLNLEKMFLK